MLFPVQKNGSMHPIHNGKSTAGTGLPKYFKATQVTTVSNKYYTWIHEGTNFNVLHSSNDEFKLATTGVDWNKMDQSITSVVYAYATPGSHLVVLEGHRLFENQALMDMGDYVVFLTLSTQAVLRARKTTQLFVDLYGCFQKYGYPKMDGENNGKPY